MVGDCSLKYTEKFLRIPVDQHPQNCEQAQYFAAYHNVVVAGRPGEKRAMPTPLAAESDLRHTLAASCAAHAAGARQPARKFRIDRWTMCKYKYAVCAALCIYRRPRNGHLDAHTTCCWEASELPHFHVTGSECVGNLELPDCDWKWNWESNRR